MLQNFLKLQKKLTKSSRIDVNLSRHSKGLINPYHFTLESVKERLDKYDISSPPDLQALADVMIMPPLNLHLYVLQMLGW